MKKKEIDILEMILNGERITKEIPTARGEFILSFPLPKDIRKIELEVARMLDGLSESAFSRERIANFRVYATLDQVIVGSPDWWDRLESAENCPDDELVLKLYRGYLRFYSETQRKIAKSKFRGTSKVGVIDSKNEDVGGGAFSDLTHGSPLPDSD